MKLSVAEIQQVCRKLGQDDLSLDDTKKYLNQLKDGVVATEDVLRATGAGQRLHKLASYHKDSDIREAAQDLKEKWKATLRSSSGVSKARSMASSTAGSASASKKAGLNAIAVNRMVDAISSQASGSSGSSASVSTRTASSVAVSVLTAASTPVSARTAASTPASSRTAASVPAPAKAAGAGRTADTDKVVWQVTGNQTRDGCIKLMYNGLCANTDLPPDYVLRVAVKVENSGYEFFNQKTDVAYRTKMRSLFQNLKVKTNPDLPRKVLSGAIPPERFVAMSEEELKSDKLKVEEARIKQVNLNNAMVAQVEKSVSRTLKCGKCQEKMVSYSQAQTRSADEPMTTFCECINCGNRWKFS